MPLQQLIKNAFGDLMFNIISLQAELAIKTTRIDELEKQVAELHPKTEEAVG